MQGKAMQGKLFHDGRARADSVTIQQTHSAIGGNPKGNSNSTGETLDTRQQSRPRSARRSSGAAHSTNFQIDRWFPARFALYESSQTILSLLGNRFGRDLLCMLSRVAGWCISPLVGSWI